ncbi:uncharacterized protein V1516DRAFT_671701 [Lipomyces oligophaga]|uniref:uncharacterized protein n=1 Tax=Lipomyces oligophaga TaxID=45792 RepID=UPI0034CD6E01
MNYASLKVVELKELLKTRGLPSSGVKKDLVERLEGADRSEVIHESSAAAEEDNETKDERDGNGFEDGTEIPTKAVLKNDAAGEVDVPVLVRDADADAISEPVNLKDDKHKIESKTGSSDLQNTEGENGNLNDQAAVLQHSTKQESTTGMNPEDIVDLSHIATEPSNTATISDTVTSQVNKRRAEEEIGETFKRSKDQSPPADGVITEVTAEPLSSSAKFHATKSIYIQNFSRPLNIPSLKKYLEAAAGESLAFFWIDSIRTHCFAVFESIAGATKVQELVYNSTFPVDEKGRNPLITEFIPDEKVTEFIELEESADGRGKRWVVDITGETADGVLLVEAGLSGRPGRSGRQIPNALTSRIASMPNPLGLARDIREFDADANANKSKGRSSDFRIVGASGESESNRKQTNARPRIYYSEAPRDLVQARLSKLRR